MRKTVYVELHPGCELWSVATGKLNMLRKASRDAVKFMGDREGFVCVNITPDGRMIWFFESENAAKIARNEAEAIGIVCGSNICRFVVAADGVPEFADDRYGNR